MFFESYKSILYSDTLLPDIFITEYMSSMDSQYIKIYIYCLFLSKHGKHASAEQLSKKLEIGIDKVKDGLLYLESVGIITKTKTGMQIHDLKEKEIKKIYRMKTTSSPEEAAQSSERNKKRNNIVAAINNSFFQGLMSPSWYTDIDAWFDRYEFEEDVMYALFKQSYDHKGLSKQYIIKVADNWCNKGIKNSFDLDRYFVEYQKLREIKQKISKKLKLNRVLTEYEQEYVEKWVEQYNFNFEIIDLSLRKTTSKTNPNFQYINSLLTDWYKKELKTKEDIAAYIKNRSQNAVKTQSDKPSIPQRENFQQRKHDDSHYNNFFNNT